MNINLNNYESFFLLYIDNELPVAEKKAVEDFLKDHTYLQDEFDLLKETILPAEENSFAFKGSLLKPILSEQVLQENLLLHLDNELTGEAREALEKQLLSDNQLQKDWAILRKTKLNADEKIVHPDKTELYRHERARIITGRFLRLAIAAVLLGAGIFVGVNIVNQQDNAPVDMATHSQDVKTKKATDNSIKDDVKNKPGNITPGNTAIASANQATAAVDAGSKATNIATGKEKKEYASKDRETIAKTSPDKQPGFNPVNTPAPEKEPGVMPARNEAMARLEQPERDEPGKTLPIAKVDKKPTMLTDTNIQPVENQFARTASFVNDEISDDHIFMMEEEKVSRTRAAGFLKKMKRTVERTTKIKTGNSLRIAGFEIAVK